MGFDSEDYKKVKDHFAEFLASNPPLGTGSTVSANADIGVRSVTISPGSPYTASALAYPGGQVWGTKHVQAPPPSGDTTGATDLAMLTALVANGGVDIQLQPGTYYINSNIGLWPNTAIKGAGAGITIVKVANSSPVMSSCFVCTDVANVFFSDFTIDLNKSGYANNGNQAQQMGIFFYAGSVTGITNCRITRMKIINGWQEGLRGQVGTLGWPLELYIDQCSVDSCGFIGMHCYGGTNLVFLRNTVTNCGTDGILNDAGTKCIIEGNTCNNNGDHGIVAGNTGATNIVCVGNICNNNGNVSLLGSGIVISRNCSQFTVSGNTVNANYNCGITIDPKDGTNNLQVANGVVSDNSCSNTVLNHGINLNYCRDVLVVGNTCSGNSAAGASGIAVTGGLMIITNNILKGNYYGIQQNNPSPSTPGAGGNLIGANFYDGNTNADYKEDPALAVPNLRLVVTTQSPAPTIGKVAAAIASIAAITSPNDGQKHVYDISGTVTITTLGSGVINLEVTYTDDNGTARTCIIPLCAEAGAFAAAANTADAWKGHVTIAVNPNTAVTVLTAGTFTGCTYNASAQIKQVV